MNLTLFEPRYLRLYEARADHDPAFGMVMVRSNQDVDFHVDIHAIGTMAHFVDAERKPNGTINVSVVGTTRFTILDVDWETECPTATVEDFQDAESTGPDARARIAKLNQRFELYVRGISALTGRRFRIPVSDPDPDRELEVFALASRLPLHSSERQRLIETASAGTRLGELERLMARELALMYKAGAAGLVVNHPGHMFVLN